MIIRHAGRPGLFLLVFLFFGAACAAPAAQFDLDAGRTVLRQLQYCSHCGSALLVTGVRSGTLVRCPDCGHEQPRLGDGYLLTQIYQLCKTCLGPLNPLGHHPGDVVECAICRTRQVLEKSAFLPEKYAVGQGYMPGFPPGSGRKTRLFSRATADAPVMPIPLPDNFSDLPPPSVAAAARPIPRPPERPDVIAQIDPNREAALAPLPAAPSAGAVDVPAVTVDLFGGRRSGGEVRPGTIGRGGMLARVDGKPIYAVDVRRVVEPVMRRLRERAGPEVGEELAAREADLRREVLERLIDRELALAEAESLGFKPDSNAVRQREGELAQLLGDGGGVDLRREAERDVTMNAMRIRNGVRPGEVNPSAVREYYSVHKGEMVRPRLLALDQLVIYQDRADRSDARDYRTIAEEVSARLEGGARFADVRLRFDEFLPEAGVEWVEPGLKPEGAYARQVLLAGGDLRRGAVFGPVFMDGMALFGKVVSERPEGPAPFEEVESEIRAKLEVEATERNLDVWLKRLRARAKIEYFRGVSDQ